MTLLPKTLSKSVRSELYPASCYANEDALIEKLKTRPRLLFAFIVQASLSRAFVKKHVPLMTKGIVEINTLIFSNVLSYEEGCKAFRVFTKLKKDFFYLFPSDLYIRNNDINHRYTRFFFMMACEKLRDASLLSTNVMPLSAIASKVANIEEFSFIYNTFFTYDFTFFYTVSNQVLTRLAIQSEHFGYKKGIHEFQALLCNRLIHAGDLFCYYSIAKSNGLSLVEEHCKKKLDEFEYIYIHENGDIYLSAVRFILDEEVFCDLKSIERIHFADNYYQERFDPRLHCPGALERIELAFDQYGSVSIKRMTTREANLVQRLRHSFYGREKKKIDKLQVKSIIFDGRFNVSIEEKMGMALYFEKLEEASFYYFKGIDSDEFNKFLRAVPFLKFLRIKRCSDISEKNIISIAILLKALQKLILSNVHLSSKCLRLLLLIPNLSHLALLNSTFESENIEDSLFLKLEYLDLSGSNGSKNHLNTLLQAARNIHTLIAEKIENFSLELIACPDRVKELGLDADQMHKFFVEGDANCIDRFTSLKSIYVSGSPSESLTRFLSTLPKTVKIQFKKDA